MKKTNNSKNAKRAKIQRIRLIAGVCCVVVLLVACGMIGWSIHRTQQRLEMVSGLQSMYSGSVAKASAETVAPTAVPAADGEAAPVNPQAQSTDAPAAPVVTDVPAPTATPAPAFDENGNPIAHADFAPLLDINEHLVGWLDAGSAISLPIVHYDNDFYLDHDFYGNWDDAGTVFINEVNTVWPADKHMLMHGHNMRDGSAFGPLQESYSNVDFLKNNPVIYFRTINQAQATAYVPVAIFECSVTRGNYGYFDIGKIFFDDGEEFLGFVSDALDRSMYQLPVDVQEDDQLISLITCSYGYQNGRFIVMCRELREGETIESVTQLMQQAAKK